MKAKVLVASKNLKMQSNSFFNLAILISFYELFDEVFLSAKLPTFREFANFAL